MRTSLTILCLALLAGLSWPQETKSESPPRPPKWVRHNFVGPPPADLLLSKKGTVRWVGLLGERRFRSPEGFAVFALTPDGKKIVSAGRNKFPRGTVSAGRGAVLRVWDADTGLELQAISLSDFVSIGDVAVDPKAGQTVAVGGYTFRGYDYERRTYLQLWNLDTGELIRSLYGHECTVNSVEFFPDGRRLASASTSARWGDRSVRIWDVGTGEDLSDGLGQREGGLRGKVMALAVSPNGRWIVSASRGVRDSTLMVWEARTGKKLRTLRGHSKPVGAVAFAPSGKWIVSGGRDRTVRVWGATNGRELRLLEGHEGAVSDVAVSPDGKRIYSVGYSLRVWDISSGKQVWAHSGRGFNSMVVDPGGTFLFTGSGPTLGVWDAATGEEVREPVGHISAVRYVACDPAGAWVASVGLDGALKLWDAATAEELQDLEGHSDAITGLAADPAGKWLVSSSRDKTLKLWDAITGKKQRTLSGHELPVTCVAVSGDGQWIASGSLDKTVRLWEAATGKRFRTLGEFAGVVTGLALSPDGRWILAASGNSITVWDASTGEQQAALPEETSQSPAIAFSPDGAWFVTGARDGAIRTWDASTWTERKTIAGDGTRIAAVAVSGDGKWIYSAEQGGDLRVWDAESGLEVDSIRVDGLATCLSVMGRRVVVGCANSTVCIYEYTPEGE